MMITACECKGQPPHTHVPVKTRVLLDNGREVEFDLAHYRLNHHRIVKHLGVVPARIEFW